MFYIILIFIVGFSFAAENDPKAEEIEKTVLDHACTADNPSKPQEASSPTTSANDSSPHLSTTTPYINSRTFPLEAPHISLEAPYTSLEEFSPHRLPSEATSGFSFAFGTPAHSEGPPCSAWFKRNTFGHSPIELFNGAQGTEESFQQMTATLRKVVKKVDQLSEFQQAQQRHNSYIAHTMAVTDAAPAIPQHYIKALNTFAAQFGQPFRLLTMHRYAVRSEAFYTILVTHFTDIFSGIKTARSGMVRRSSKAPKSKKDKALKNLGFCCTAVNFCANAVPIAGAGVQQVAKSLQPILEFHISEECSDEILDTFASSTSSNTDQISRACAAYLRNIFLWYISFAENDTFIAQLGSAIKEILILYIKELESSETEKQGLQQALFLSLFHRGQGVTINVSPFTRNLSHIFRTTFEQRTIEMSIIDILLGPFVGWHPEEKCFQEPGNGALLQKAKYKRTWLGSKRTYFNRPPGRSNDELNTMQSNGLRLLFPLSSSRHVFRDMSSIQNSPYFRKRIYVKLGDTGPTMNYSLLLNARIVFGSINLSEISASDSFPTTSTALLSFCDTERKAILKKIDLHKHLPTDYLASEEKYEISSIAS